MKTVATVIALIFSVASICVAVVQTSAPPINPAVHAKISTVNELKSTEFTYKPIPVTKSGGLLKSNKLASAIASAGYAKGSGAKYVFSADLRFYKTISR